MSFDSEEKTLYVANLDRNVNEELLYELFLQAGPIEKVNIPRGNNDSRYGFITYKHPSSIDYAMELYKGTRLFRKELVIKIKQERANNQQMNVQNQFGEFNFPMMSQGFVVNPIQPNFAQLLAFSQMLMPNNMSVQNNFNNSPNQNQRNNESWRGNSNRNRPYDRNTRERRNRHDYHDRRKGR